MDLCFDGSDGVDYHLDIYGIKDSVGISVCWLRLAGVADLT